MPDIHPHPHETQSPLMSVDVSSASDDCRPELTRDSGVVTEGVGADSSVAYRGQSLPGVGGSTMGGHKGYWEHSENTFPLFPPRINTTASFAINLNTL